MKKFYITKAPRSFNDDVQIESDKLGKIYEVLPPIGSQPKHPIEQTNSELFSGQYHYPPEIEEMEINENDPENTDMKSVVDEFPEFIFPELLSLDQFYREQSPLPYDRVLTFLPEYVDSMERELTETTSDIPQSNSVDTDMAQSSVVPSSTDLELSNKLKILNYPSLIRTAAKIKLASVPKPKILPEPIEVPNKVKPTLTNTMLHKPVKHTRIPIETEKKPSPPSPSPSPQKAIVKRKNNIDAKKEHFSRSINSVPFVSPPQSEITTDDNTSSIIVENSQPSLTTRQDNNKHDEEKQIQRINTTKKHSVTSTQKLPTKKSVPISTHEKMESKFPWDIDDSDENRVDMLKFGFNITAVELPRENRS